MKKWSSFTKDNIENFNKLKYSIDTDNKLLLNLKTERNNIREFIKTNSSIEYNVRHIDFTPDILNEIKEYSNVSWVDSNNVIKEVPSLSETILIEWISINNATNPNTILLKTSSDKTETILSRMKLIVYIIEYLKNKSNCKKSVKIYLILTELKKYFPDNDNIIDIHNVNTGYTDLLKDIIFVWRLEEFEKVLFHEVAHFLDMDIRDTPINKLVNIKGPHSYYEVITDYYAIFYNIIFLALVTNVSIKTLLEYELGFIRNQAMILNDFFGLDSWRIKPNKTIIQKTPAFSYYIIKYLVFEELLNNFEDISKNYKSFLIRVLNKGFEHQEFNKIRSSRMTLFQLK